MLEVDEPLTLDVETEAEEAPVSTLPPGPTTLPPVCEEALVWLDMSALASAGNVRATMVVRMSLCIEVFYYPTVHLCAQHDYWAAAVVPQAIERIFFMVIPPTEPVGPVRPIGVKMSAAYLLWKVLTATRVIGPKKPVAGSVEAI